MKYFLAGTVCLVAFMAGSYADADSKTARGHYVNMGSSFAAGSGIEPASPGSVPRCMQSESSYASLLAVRLELELEDRSCAGARSVHLLKPWKDLPAQLEAIRGDTQLVTITVGGNDLSYVRNLMAAGCSEEEGFRFGDRTVPCFEETPVAEELFAQLKVNLLEVSNRIAMTAPAADVIFVQYLTLVPEDLCETTPLTEAEASRLRTIGTRLAAITAAAAKETGAMVLNIDTMSIGHTACDPDPWSIGAKATARNNEGISWHPNRRGNEIIADRLQEML